MIMILMIMMKTLYNIKYKMNMKNAVEVTHFSTKQDQVHQPVNIFVLSSDQKN